MCGIVGYTGYQNAKNIVIDGLKTLEYRGYDSAGIALCNEKLSVFKTAGRVSQLANTIPDEIIYHTAIGHTRWATHGEPNAVNSHPHLSFDGKIAIVHNGVIENCEELRAMLIEKGISFSSQTDSEIIAHLLALENTDDMIQAMENVGRKLQGATTFLAIKNGDDAIYVRRFGASLAVGFGNGENFVASDTLAISKHTLKMAILNDGESSVITPQYIKFYRDGKQISKQPVRIKRSVPKECSCHMRSEIDEIPDALESTYKSIKKDLDYTTLKNIQNANKIYLIGCGTAYHAGLYGKEVFETLLHIPCECVVASEADNLRFIDDKSFVVAITQSGETADTLIALDLCKQKGAKTLAITNVEGSSITFQADKTLFLDAGAEVAVAATKSYNCQLLSLYLIAKTVCGQPVDENEIKKLRSAVRTVSFLSLYEERIKKTNLFFVGKGSDNVTAQEGALKFKEITYKMTDAYSAGELKHGTIALIDDKSTSIVIASCAQDKHRIETTVNELRSRGAYVIGISSIGDIGANKTFSLPFIDDNLLYPIISVIPLQNLSLTASLCLGLNPDKPRNLAKSVTVI